ncbi:MAG: penicillin-binding protein 2 [Chitinophagaceae bacterium]|jgi:penicillin-binding protein 2|nr:penicillin-binding protein 2 [Chitinophagaceae bacterium]
MITLNSEERKRVVLGIFFAVFLIIIAQLVHLQIFSPKLRLQAENNAIYRKVVYPDRGIIYDRKKRAILENVIMYDLTVIPADARKGVDVPLLCKILNIDTVEYNKRMVAAIVKNGRTKVSVFEALLSSELLARLNENIYRFPGFTMQERPIRHYPFNVAANVLGYTGEVDTTFLRQHAEEGYQSGDYTGKSGLERSYEKVLMGQRGVNRFLRNNKGRIEGPWEKGMYDTVAVAGRGLYTSIDVELQQLAEKLLQNKIGSVVAIDPKTGGILAMASSPSYNPNDLSGSERRKNYAKLVLDTARPMYNRAIQGMYPPGSTFKPLDALIALNEGVITPAYGYPCSGAYYGCGSKVIKCTEKWSGHSSNLRLAIAWSCNSYFLQTFRLIVDNPQYQNTREGYSKWKSYMNNFGYGVKLGVDLPGEREGNIQTPERYDKDFGSQRWNSCNMVTLGIGQDRMTATPLQIANEACIIANNGYYYTPHFVDSIENQTIDDTVYLGKYKIKHSLLHISDDAYKIVHLGMADVATTGTASRITVPGVKFAAKTGTAQNPHGKDHAIFMAYAPLDNPKIAIAVVVENAGFGATWAGPIGGFMMEKYINDTLTDKSKDEVEKFSKVNLIPDAIKHWYYMKDSIKLIKQKKAIEEAETFGTLPQAAVHRSPDEQQESIAYVPKAMPNDSKSHEAGKNKNIPILQNTLAILPDNKKKKTALIANG